MSVARIPYKEGQPSINDVINERIRMTLGVHKDKFYGMGGCQCEVVGAFLNGMSIGRGDREIVTEECGLKQKQR